MTNVIANLELVAVSVSGDRKPTTIRVGRPFAIRDGRGADCAACPVMIEGMFAEDVKVHGDETADCRKRYRHTLCSPRVPGVVHNRTESDRGVRVFLYWI